MVTWANEHYLDFAITWVAALKRANITGYAVGAMDDDMLKALVQRGINTWRMNTGITKNDLGWGSPNFHKMGRCACIGRQRICADTCQEGQRSLPVSWLTQDLDMGPGCTFSAALSGVRSCHPKLWLSCA